MESYVSEYGTIGGTIGGTMTTYGKNVCLWYDGTIRPVKGHNLKCRWHFDGQVWWHERTR